jgi:hypothetical protein
MIWRANLGVGEFSQAGGVRATAAYSNGTIFVATNVLSTISLLTGAIVGSSLPGEGANIYALNAETGETRWKQNVGSTIDGSLVIANGVLYHIENNLGFFARDPATGKELWSVTLKLFFGAGPSILNGRIYLSAGYNVASNSTSLPNTDGSQIISFGLDAPTTPKVWQARVDDPEKPFTEPECETAVAMASDWPGGGKPSAACTSCLCQCNATAAGNCDSCWLQAPCAAKSCNLSQPGNDMHLCMSLNCEGKLVPGYVFEDSVQVAPCAVKCATMCGFN